MKTHDQLSLMDDDEIQTEIRKTRLCNDEYKRIKKSIEGTSTSALLTDEDKYERKIAELDRDNEMYNTNVKFGEIIDERISMGYIKEASLSMQNKHCLNLFRTQRKVLNVSEATLRPWQEKLLDIMQKFNDREIIWVKGTQGNEGKSWFQEYVQSFYGVSRVVRFDITNKSSDIVHILTKCELSSINIFLFNEQRCIAID